MSIMMVLGLLGYSLSGPWARGPWTCKQKHYVSEIWCACCCFILPHFAVLRTVANYYLLITPKQLTNIQRVVLVLAFASTRYSSRVVKLIRWRNPRETMTGCWIFCGLRLFVDFMMLSKLASTFTEKLDKFVKFIRGDNKSRDKPFADSDQEWYWLPVTVHYRLIPGYIWAIIRYIR